MVREWKLSSIDRFSLNLPINGAWIYRESPDYGKMKESLAKLQEAYPQLGGRYDVRSNSLKWDDLESDPLPFSTVSCREYSADGLAGNPEIWKLVAPYDAKAFRKGKIGPFSAVLAELNDGSVLFIQCAHGIMDAHTFYRLIDEWASLYRGDQTEIPFAEQFPLSVPEVLSREETLLQNRKKGWVKVGTRQKLRALWNIVRARKTYRTTCHVEVSPEELKQLRKESGAGLNAVLTALATKTLAQHIGREECYRMNFMANLRGMIDGVGAAYFGNMSMPVSSGREYDLSADSAVLAEQIETALFDELTSEKLGENIRLMHSNDSHRLPFFPFDPSDITSSAPKVFHVNNLLSFKACDLDWGTGKPVYAFPSTLTEMIDFWRPVSKGPVLIVYGGAASGIMKKQDK